MTLDNILEEIKKAETIAKKLGKQTLTQYEEAYIETWVNEYKYDLSIIENIFLISFSYKYIVSPSIITRIFLP